jgi:hypothetical protein
MYANIYHEQIVYTCIEISYISNRFAHSQNNVIFCRIIVGFNIAHLRTYCHRVCNLVKESPQ